MAPDARAFVIGVIVVVVVTIIIAIIVSVPLFS